MLVAPVADPGSGGAVPSGQEERRSFHREEAFADAAREETETVSEGIILFSLEGEKQQNKRGWIHGTNAPFFCMKWI